MTNPEAPRGREMVISEAEIAERERTEAIKPYVAAKEMIENAAGAALGLISQEATTQVARAVTSIKTAVGDPFEVAEEATKFPTKPDGSIVEFVAPDPKGDIVVQATEATIRYMKKKVSAVDDCIEAARTGAQRAREGVPQMVGDERAKRLGKHHDKEVARINTASDENLKQIITVLGVVGQLNNALSAVSAVLKPLSKEEGNLVTLNRLYIDYRKDYDEITTETAISQSKKNTLVRERERLEELLAKAQEAVRQREALISQATAGNTKILSEDDPLFSDRNAALVEIQGIMREIENIGEQIKPHSQRIEEMKRKNAALSVKYANTTNSLDINRQHFEQIVQAFLDNKVDSGKLQNAIEHIPEDNPGREEFLEQFSQYEKALSDFEHEYHRTRNLDDPNLHLEKFLDLMAKARRLMTHHNDFVHQYTASQTIGSSEAVFARTKQTIEDHHAAGITEVEEDTAVAVDGENQRQYIDATERAVVGRLKHVRELYMDGIALVQAPGQAYVAATYTSFSTLWSAQHARQLIQKEQRDKQAIDNEETKAQEEIDVCNEALRQLEAARKRQEDPAIVSRADAELEAGLQFKLAQAKARLYTSMGSSNTRQKHLNETAADAVARRDLAGSQYSARQTAVKNLGDTVASVVHRGDADLELAVRELLGAFQRPLEGAIASGVPTRMNAILNQARQNEAMTALAGRIATQPQKRRGILGILGIGREKPSQPQPKRLVNPIERVALTQLVQGQPQRKQN